MSQQPISLSPDLKKLRDEGFDLEIRVGFLLVKDVPYVTSRKEIKRGVLVCKLILAGNVASKPDSHVAYFSGEYPCDQDGNALEKIRNQSGQQTLANGVVVDHTFSAKPLPSGQYPNYYEKVVAYVTIFSQYVTLIDRNITAKTHPTIEPSDDEDDGVFNYIDTASSRAEIDLASQKLRVGKVAIIGLGGTGSYVLDLVAKTPVKEIHLFDGDLFLQHNAFRSPGAPSLDELRQKPHKLAYLHSIYSKMHRGIIAHQIFIDADNVSRLLDMDFVFLCLDKGAAKEVIVKCLENSSIPFVDAGMGLYMNEGAIGGILRVTTSTPKQRNHMRSRVSFADDEGNNEYTSNIQVADLNSLNAALAVIKWKKLCGFYSDLDQEHNSTYTIDGNHLLNEDRPA